MGAARLHVCIPADSRMIQKLPWPEEGDDVHHDPADRANSVSAVVVAQTAQVYGLFYQLNGQIPTIRTARPVRRFETGEQTSLAIASWSSPHRYGSRRSG